MKKRRDFIKWTGLTSLGIAGGMMGAFAIPPYAAHTADLQEANVQFDNETLSVIGLYGPWAAGLTENKLPAFSFRREEWSDIEKWRVAAITRLEDRLAIPEIGGMPEIKVNKQFEYDGLQVEMLSWQLSNGRPTEAILLKPIHAKGRLPAILAFHDHGGNKYFGTRKITRTSAQQHPLIEAHQKEYYESRAWANEIARRGYVVLVSDAFPFASRRVMLQDVPVALRHGLSDLDPEKPANINAYNLWAGEHEHVMAKSLFSAGTTWPGVFFAEDRIALDILCARPDVDPNRIGCGGLSGGGMRTVFMAGLDPRIRCAVCVGFMTTWKDFLLNKSVNHTWMTYVPRLPGELDFPEILGLRVPLPTLVLNDEADDLYTPAEMRTAESILKAIYQKAGMPDRFHCSYYPGPHKFDRKMQDEAFDWFDKWLKS
jgi:dienelactone hydrolase